jgi:hypothetical protein
MARTPAPYGAVRADDRLFEQQQEMIMRAIASALLALSILGAFAAQAVAYDPDAHDAKRFFAERDREAR